MSIWWYILESVHGKIYMAIVFRSAAVLCLLMLLPSGTAARADDFASDMAACAKGPIDLTKFAFEDGKTAAEFTVNHSECVPSVVGGDPLLYGLTGAVAILQQQGTLPKGAQACIDASIGQASKPVAGALDAALNTTGLSSLLPAQGQSMLKDIANGQSQATLYQVPGVALVMDRVACSCAVASTGLDVDELKERLTSVIASVEGCADIPGKLVSGAYDVGKAAVEGLGGAAEAGYEGAKGLVNSAGCALGLGGCDDSGPPLFCDGYNAARAGGMTAAQFREIIAGFGAGSVFNLGEVFAAETNRCEQAWADAIAKAAEKAKVKAAQAAADAAYKAEQLRLAQEAEKAGKLGAANALGFAFHWSPKCRDGNCKAGIAKMADQYTEELQDPEVITAYGSFGAAKAALDEKYNVRAELAVAISQAKAEKFEKLGAANALGFALRWSPKCLDDACKSGIAKMAGQYRSDMQDADAIDSYGSFAAAKSALDKKYDTRAVLAVALSKERNKALRADVNAPAEERLAAFGCRSFLGREGQWLCSDDESFDVCKDYARQDDVDMCAQAGSPARFYSAGRGLELVLRQGGCIPGKAPKFTAQCLSGGGRYNCDALVRGASGIKCKGPPLLIVNASRTSILPEQPATIRPKKIVPALSVERSTLCRFTSGARAGEIQDYAPMDPIPVGRPCQDGFGSNGVVVARSLTARPKSPSRLRPALPLPLRRALQILPPAIVESTLCRFTSGPREGDTQDYAPMAPIPVGSPCQDGRGSGGTVVAR